MKIYPFEKKVSTIMLLSDNDGNKTATAATAGVTYVTLSKWNKKYGHIIRKLIKDNKGDLSKVTKIEYERLAKIPARTLLEEGDVQEESFKAMVTEAKILAIKRLKTVMAIELDTKKVADALKLLVEIEEDDGSTLGKDGKTIDDYVEFLIAGYAKDKVKN